MNNFIRKPSNPEGETLIPGQEILVESGDLLHPENPEIGENTELSSFPKTDTALVNTETPHIEHVLQDLDPISGDPKHQELLRQLKAEIQKGGDKAGLNFLLGQAAGGANPAMIEVLKEELLDRKE